MAAEDLAPNDRPAARLSSNSRTAFELANQELRADRLAPALARLEEFLASHQETLTQAELQICERILDRQFEHERDRTLPLYRRLAVLGSRRHHTVMLALETALNA